MISLPCYVIGSIVHVHHIAPSIRWWSRREWTKFKGQMESTTILKVPFLMNVLWFHNIFVHVPHHVDARIRFDKLPIAQGAQAPAKVELSKGGAVVAIDGVLKNNDLWEVRTRVRFDNKSKSFESHLNWVTENEAYLVGPDKKRITAGGYLLSRLTETYDGEVLFV